MIWLKKITNALTIHYPLLLACQCHFLQFSSHSCHKLALPTSWGGRGVKRGQVLRAALCRGRHLEGQKCGILKFGCFWRFGVCVAQRIRWEFALRNHTPQLCVLFVTVHTNVIVVSIRISITNLTGGGQHRRLTRAANNLAPPLLPTNYDAKNLHQRLAALSVSQHSILSLSVNARSH